MDSFEDHLAQRDGRGALSIALHHAEVAAISAEVRTRLRQPQIIARAEIVVEVGTPSGHANQIALARGHAGSNG